MNFDFIVLLLLLTLAGCGVKAPPSYAETEKIPPWEEQFLKKNKPSKEKSP